MYYVVNDIKCSDNYNLGLIYRKLTIMELCGTPFHNELHVISSDNLQSASSNLSLFGTYCFLVFIFCYVTFFSFYISFDSAFLDCFLFILISSFFANEPFTTSSFIFLLIILPAISVYII